MSFSDPKIAENFKDITRYNNFAFNLDKDFVVTREDFKKIFACAYVTSLRRQLDYVTGFKTFEVEPNEKKALFFEFDFPIKEGFFDFSIKQLDENKIEPSRKSKIKQA